MKAITTVATAVALTMSSLTFAGGKDISGIVYVDEADANPSVAVYDVQSKKLHLGNTLKFYGGFFLQDSFPYAALQWDEDKGCFGIDELIEEDGRTSSGLVIIPTPEEPEDEDEEVVEEE